MNKQLEQALNNAFPHANVRRKYCKAKFKEAMLSSYNVGYLDAVDDVADRCRDESVVDRDIFLGEVMLVAKAALDKIPLNARTKKMASIEWLIEYMAPRAPKDIIL